MAVATISVNFASNAEALAGTSTTTSISPARLRHAVENWTGNTAFVKKAGDTMTGSLVVQGTIQATGDITAFSTSDRTLKNNIEKLDSALAKLNKINGVSFDWNEEAEKYGKFGHDVGVIAQEVEEVLPEVVASREDGTKAVRYEKLTPLLIEAIKDLSKKVEELEAKLQGK